MADPAQTVEADRIDGAPHPRQTSVLFGQTAAEEALSTAIGSGQLHHGWLLTGPRGIGKATLAWRAARRILAGPGAPGLLGPAPGDLHLDPEDPVFRQVAALGHRGLKLCRREPDPKTERMRTALTVDTIRGLQGFFGLSEVEGGARVAIIDSADEMNASAANALLKMLEEPPRNAILFLISHQPHSLLPTIRSRCRVLRLAPLGPDDLRAALVAAGIDSEDISPAALMLAEGSVADAITLIRSGGAGDYNRLLGLLAEAPSLPRDALQSIAGELSGRDASARYDSVMRLTERLVIRMTRLGAGSPGITALPGEAEQATRLVPDPAAARLWAEASARNAARVAHATAVNLDPAEVFLDTILSYEKTAAHVLSRRQ